MSKNGHLQYIFGHYKKYEILFGYFLQSQVIKEVNYL